MTLPIIKFYTLHKMKMKSVFSELKQVKKKSKKTKVGWKRWFRSFWR